MIAQPSLDRKGAFIPVRWLGMSRSAHPSTRQGGRGYEKTLARQLPRGRRPPVQACGSEMANNVGAAKSKDFFNALSPYVQDQDCGW